MEKKIEKNTKMTLEKKEPSKNIGIFSSIEEFWTFFDTCNSFTCDINEVKIKEICNEITFLIREPMKSSVWKSRCNHHVFLMVDGICKARCLFEDYDETFTPKDEDYEVVEKILQRMVRGWDTNIGLRKSLNLMGVKNG